MSRIEGGRGSVSSFSGARLSAGPRLGSVATLERPSVTASRTVIAAPSPGRVDFRAMPSFDPTLPRPESPVRMSARRLFGETVPLVTPGVEPQKFTLIVHPEKKVDPFARQIIGNKPQLQFETRQGRVRLAMPSLSNKEIFDKKQTFEGKKFDRGSVFDTKVPILTPGVEPQKSGVIVHPEKKVDTFARRIIGNKPPLQFETGQGRIRVEMPRISNQKNNVETQKVDVVKTEPMRLHQQKLQGLTPGVNQLPKPGVGMNNTLVATEVATKQIQVRPQVQEVTTVAPTVSAKTEVQMNTTLQPELHSQTASKRREQVKQRQEEFVLFMKEKKKKTKEKLRLIFVKDTRAARAFEEEGARAATEVIRFANKPISGTELMKGFKPSEKMQSHLAKLKGVFDGSFWPRITFMAKKEAYRSPEEVLATLQRATEELPPVAASAGGERVGTRDVDLVLNGVERIFKPKA